MSTEELQAPRKEKKSVIISADLIDSLKKEFNLADNKVDEFIASLVEKKILEHIDEVNSSVFTESETKDIEDDLKGLGYI